MSNLNNNTTQLEALLAKVNALPEAGGVDLPELTNEATSAELLASKQLIDGNGNIVTGSMPNNGAISQTMDGINTKSITIPSGYTSGGSVSLDDTIDNEVTEQADLITQIKSVVNSLPEAGGSSSGGSVETCTVTITNYSECPMEIIATTVNNGIEGHYVFLHEYNGNRTTPPYTISNIKCGSVITVITTDANAGTEADYELDNGSSFIQGCRLSSQSAVGRWPFVHVFTAPTIPGAHGTIVAEVQ